MKKKEISLAFENTTAHEWNAWIRNYNSTTNPRPLNREEYLALRDAIMNYERVAQEFFYVTLNPFVNGLAYKLRQTYNVEVAPCDLSTIIYCEFWDEGRFTRLIIYRGDCSLFSWVSRVAAQVVYDQLDKQGFIRKNCALTAKNTSLRLKSIADKDELMAILDLVSVPRWHDVLAEIYLNHSSFQSMMQKFKMDELTLKKTVKVAESSLKEQLIASKNIIWKRPGATTSEDTVVNLVSLALGDVSGHIDTTSSDAAFTKASAQLYETGFFEDVREVLQLKYPGLEPEAMWQCYVNDEAMACGMSPDQYEVWTSRYVDHESPVSIARRLGMKRANVDNLYSRANKLLTNKIRKNWKVNS